MMSSLVSSCSGGAAGRPLRPVCVCLGAEKPLGLVAGSASVTAETVPPRMAALLCARDTESPECANAAPVAVFGVAVFGVAVFGVDWAACVLTLRAGFVLRRLVIEVEGDEVGDEVEASELLRCLAPCALFCAFFCPLASRLSALAFFFASLLSATSCL